MHSRYATWVVHRYILWGFVCGESNVHVCCLAWKYKCSVAGQTDCNKLYRYSTGLRTAPSVKCKLVATNPEKLMKSCTVRADIVLASAQSVTAE